MLPLLVGALVPQAVLLEQAGDAVLGAPEKGGEGPAPFGLALLLGGVLAR